MKKIIATIALATAGSLSHAAVIPDVYYGVNAGSTHLRADKNIMGVARVPILLPELGAFVGFQFTPNLSLELGYSSSQNKGRDSTIFTGDLFLGRTAAAGDNNDTYRIRVKNTNLEANLVGKYEISSKNKVSLLGQVGVSRLNSQVTSTMIMNNGAPATLVHAIIYGRTTTVAQLGAGVEWMFSENSGLRLTSKWQRSNRVRFDTTVAAANDGETAKFQNNFKYSFSVFSFI